MIKSKNSFIFGFGIVKMQIMKQQDTYMIELNAMLEKAIMRMKIENPGFIIYTASICTDRAAKVSAISFDNKDNSFQNVEKSNDYSRKYYEMYLSEGNFETADLFKPKESDRFCNPADFELADFVEFNHNFVPSQWYSILVRFGKLAFQKIASELNVDQGNFELGINSTKDWYDKKWNMKNFKTGNEI
ncbi:hypothetical protein GCM10022423_06380 [Flavobacterium ginsengiterrae]|uniref:Uncharacterized protein n=2 Tax=Flavobacterium ginsengiterrae TaxID=871695 RepID=A0ABP7G7R4_9FLAO